MSQATTSAGRRSRASARLGLTLRSVLLTPRDGFEGALGALERRVATSGRVSEGVAPLVLSFLGGAGAMLAWLKLGTLAGLRTSLPDDFEWGLLGAALALGGLIYVVAQILWGISGPLAAAAMRGDAAASALRLVWGAAAFPLALGLLLLPVDLLVGGPEVLSTLGPASTMGTAWAALSVALQVALALWSIYLVVRGAEVAAGVPPLAAVGMVAVAFAGVALAVAAARAGALALVAG